MFHQVRSRSVQPFARAVHPTPTLDRIRRDRGVLGRMCTARGGTWPRAPAFGVAIYGYCALLFTQLLPSLHPAPVLVLGVGAYAIALGSCAPLNPAE